MDVAEITPHLQNLIQEAGDSLLLGGEIAAEWLRQPGKIQQMENGLPAVSGANTISENLQMLATSGGTFAAVQLVSWSIGFGPTGIIAGQWAAIAD